MWEMAKRHSPCFRPLLLCARFKWNRQWYWETLYSTPRPRQSLCWMDFFANFIWFFRASVSREMKFDFFVVVVVVWFISDLIKKKVYLFLAFKIGNWTDELLTHQASTISHRSRQQRASLKIERELKCNRCEEQFRCCRSRRRGRSCRRNEKIKFIFRRANERSHIPRVHDA